MRGDGFDAPGDGLVDVLMFPDGAPDADPNVRGTVTVHLVDRNDAALPGMHVVFIDTDMTVTDVVSDASGNASASVFPGANATAIRAHTAAATYSLTTVL